MSQLDAKKVQLLCASFSEIVMPQAEKLGIQPGNIAPTSLAATIQACAYIEGLCMALVKLSAVQPYDEYGVLLGSWAFDEMYAELGHQMHLQTMQVMAEQNSIVEYSIVLAQNDLLAVVEKRPDYVPSGFSQIASGTLFEKRT